MASTFKIDPGFMRRLLFQIEESLDRLDHSILASAKSYAPYSGFVGPLQNNKKGRKQAKVRRHAKHLRDTGRIIEAEADGPIVKGGIEFTASYAWFVERGHKVGGAVKHGRSTKPAYFMARALDDHAGEIQSGSFLRSAD